jgi:penicillin-binding protein 1A
MVNGGKTRGEADVRAVGRWVMSCLRLGVRLTLISVAVLALYLHYLSLRFDVTRESFEARARSVEASIVPSRVAGTGGRYYDAALEIPLNLASDRIPAFVANAFITQEDQQFRSLWHVGVNPVTLARAIAGERLSSGRRVGASTITMQLVKNVLLSQERSVERKWYQAWLAVLVEGLFTKDEIMAMYLNTAYFGDGAYGIEAAARNFFGRSVGYLPKVNLLEAAMLAASVKRPSRFNPSTARAALERKAHELITAMSAEGYDAKEGESSRHRGPRKWSMTPYLFRDMAVRFMVPPIVRESEDSLVLGFTIDTEAQLYADLAAYNLLQEGKASGYDSSAIIIMQPDGAVVAIAAGHDYDGIDIVRNGRVSPGSTLKPFMYLCALEGGMHPDDKVNDVKRAWPKNFSERNYGEVSLEFALAHSLNTIAVQLFEKLGGDCFANTLGRVGIRLDDPGEPTAVLGSEHVSLLALAGAYASLANGGRRVEPYAVRYARNQSGTLVYQHPSRIGERIAEDRPYCELMGMLRAVTSPQGTGRLALVDRPVWGKTGTSENHRDALFAGFTGRYVAVVWLGRQAPGNVTGRITGGELPAKTFGWLTATLEAGKKPIELDCRRPIEIAAR